MRFHYVWFFWSSAFLVPWAVLFALGGDTRRGMLRVSLVTALFGLTEPIFVPRYWNPPSLFELAHRTRFDIESVIFAFAIGGIGGMLYDALTRRTVMSMESVRKGSRRHAWHRLALFGPPILFAPLYLLPWNPIYAALVSLAVGVMASLVCRPDLATKAAISGTLFFLLYGIFMEALVIFVPGYIAQVWNLPALSGVIVGGVPGEELLFGFVFGTYWASVYEHLSWRTARTTQAIANVVSSSQ